MGALADDLGRVGRGLRTLPAEGVKRSTATVRKALLSELRKDIGPDRKMSGLSNGVKFAVKTTQRGEQVVEGRVMAGPPYQRAPWFWLEEGTKAGARRIRRGSRRFVGPDFGISTQAYYHPGTPARRTWSRAVGDVSPAVRAEFDRLFQDALSRR